MQIVALIGLAVVSQGAKLDAPTQAAWETFKGMAGEWSGQANDGRKIRQSVQVIAGGSSILERSWFDAHPGEMMVTMYHLDQGKLVLTHYCVAGNQPRLQASDISGDGKKVLFTFRDATNIKDRDQGHMDKAWYEFVDANTFKSKWTWYSKGKESWMEEFILHREKGDAKHLLIEDKGGPSCCGGS
jgi:hypothetical protein